MARRGARQAGSVKATTQPPVRKVQRVNVDFPIDLLLAVDREAQRIGINRQAFIKLRMADAIAHVADKP